MYVCVLTLYVGGGGARQVSRRQNVHKARDTKDVPVLSKRQYALRDVTVFVEMTGNVAMSF